jgi:hypothetical protein
LYSCSYNHLIPLFILDYNKNINYKLKELSARRAFWRWGDNLKTFIYSKKDKTKFKLIEIDVRTSKKKYYVYGFTLDSQSHWYITKYNMLSCNSGKSWSLLSMCHKIDPDFTLDNNWYFKASELMQAIKSQDHKRGKIWVLDEAGIDLNNMKYFDEINKGLNAFLQTGRHRNYIFGFTVPYMSLVSKGVRMLMTAEMRADGYTRNNETIVFPKVMEYNGDMDKFYRKRLIVRNGNEVGHCNRILMPKPPKHLLVDYESRKKEFTSKLFDQISAKINKFEEGDKAKVTGHTITDKQEEVLKYLKMGYDVPQIVETMKVSAPPQIYTIMRSIRKKGIIIQPEKDNNGRVTNYRIIDPR